MHSSAFGAAALMVFRSFSSAARLSSLKAARYSSIVLGLLAIGCAPLPWSMVSQLLWSDRLEYRRSINQAAVVSHLPDPARVSNIRERIGIEYDEISPLSYLDSTQILIRAKYPCGGAGASMDRLRRS